MKDPIIEEIHRYRAELAKRFNYDIRAMTEHIRKKYADYPNVVDLSQQAREKRAARVAEGRASYGKQD
jgi:hypothetical protein